MVVEVALQRVHRTARGAVHVKWINFINSLPLAGCKNLHFTGRRTCNYSLMTKVNRKLRPYSTSHAQMP